MKPWDAQLAYWLIYPLRNTAVTPNHLTTLRLITGMVACWEILQNTPFHINIGGFLFALSAFIDHTDGELARLTGKTSQFGHLYDLISDFGILIGLYLSIGYILRESSLGLWSIVMSIIASLAVSTIFYVMDFMLVKIVEKSELQPDFAGFQAEDILYLFPLVTLFHGLSPFLIASAIGAPIFAVYMIVHYRQEKKKSLEGGVN